MLASTAEYMNALEKKDFLLFLNWPFYVQNKYQQPTKSLNTDELVEYLIFEWLEYGNPILNDSQLKMIYALSESSVNPFSLGRLQFSMIIILNAFFTAQVLYLEWQKLKMDNIDSNLTNGNLENLQLLYGRVSLDKNINKIRTLFLENKFIFDQAEMTFHANKISKIVDIAILVEQYITLLSVTKDQDIENSHAQIRLVLAQRLMSYLLEQAELNFFIQEQIFKFIYEIKRYQPSIKELTLLNQILPPTFAEKTWGWITFFTEKASTFLEAQTQLIPKKN